MVAANKLKNSGEFWFKTGGNEKIFTGEFY